MSDESLKGLTKKLTDDEGQPLAFAANVDSGTDLGTIGAKDHPVASAANEEDASPRDEQTTPADVAPKTEQTAPASASEPATPQGSAPVPVAPDDDQPAPMTYAQAGVDIEEGARAVDAYRSSVASTARPEVVGDLGGFGGLFSIGAAKAMVDPILVAGTDGVGTKLALAQRLGKNDTVGIDLVAMCANDVLACGAEPLFFLDYMAVGRLEAQAAAEIVNGVATGCCQAGCALIGGETAEHPGVMAPNEYDLSGFCVGLIDRPAMITPELVRNGDVLIGLASSGFHSNGYSLIRAVCVDNVSDETLTAPRKDLGGESLGDALLAPTKIYVKAVRAAIGAHPGAIHGIAHITGGGITENLNRALPTTLDAVVQLGSWTTPPVITYVCETAHLPLDEALKTFNMGIGMVLIVDAAQAEAVTATLIAAGETCSTIGAIEAGSGAVRYKPAPHSS